MHALLLKHVYYFIRNRLLPLGYFLAVRCWFALPSIFLFSFFLKGFCHGDFLCLFTLFLTWLTSDSTHSLIETLWYWRYYCREKCFRTRLTHWCMTLPFLLLPKFSTSLIHMYISSKGILLSHGLKIILWLLSTANLIFWTQQWLSILQLPSCMCVFLLASDLFDIS